MAFNVRYNKSRPDVAGTQYRKVNRAEPVNRYSLPTEIPSQTESIAYVIPNDQCRWRLLEIGSRQYQMGSSIPSRSDW
jgi:hypothetical protein